MALLPRVRIAANGYVDVLYKKKCLLRKIHSIWELFFFLILDLNLVHTRISL